MGWASDTEAAEKGQVLGVDIKVEDDSHKEVQHAEEEHSLADPLQRPPQQSAHPAGGQWLAQWAQASGCQPGQGERNRSHSQGRTGNASYSAAHSQAPIFTLTLMNLFVFYLQRH